MMIKTTNNSEVDAKFLSAYFKNLVNCFFKILPMKEREETTLSVYMRSLQIELLGCKEFIEALKNDPSYITLLSILQYLIDTPDCKVYEVRREIFHAISICDDLKSRYSNEVENEVEGVHL